jgi:hypothetical protein
MAKKAAMMLPNGAEVASIVLTDEEFACLCDDMENWFDLMGSGGQNHVKNAREAHFIPMIQRESLTQRFFDLYGVPENITMMQIVTETKAQEMMEELQTQAENEMRKMLGMPPDRSKPSGIDLN